MCAIGGLPSGWEPAADLLLSERWSSRLLVGCQWDAVGRQCWRRDDERTHWEETGQTSASATAPPYVMSSFRYVWSHAL